MAVKSACSLKSDSENFEKSYEAAVIVVKSPPTIATDDAFFRSNNALALNAIAETPVPIRVPAAKAAPHTIWGCFNSHRLDGKGIIFSYKPHLIFPSGVTPLEYKYLSMLI